MGKQPGAGASGVLTPVAWPTDEEVRSILANADRASIDDLWAALTRVRGASLREYLAAAKTMFREQADAVIRRLRGLPALTETATDLVFDLEELTEVALGRLSPAHAATIRAGFSWANVAFKYDLTFQESGSRLAIAKMNRKIEGLQGPTYDKLDRVLAGANERRLSLDDAAAEVMEMFEGMTFGRAKRIATTGTTAGFGAGEVRAIEEAGDDAAWLTQRDGDVRAEHEAADGQVRQNGMFTVGGEELEHPGDPSGSAANVVNCRCAVLPKSKE